MKIGKYLELEDLTVSDTAIRKGIDNTPPQEIIDELTNIVKFVYDPLCDNLGTMVRVNSGYRSVRLNRSIGGSATSQHCKGQALDLSFRGYKTALTNSTIFHYILHNLDFDQLIWEGGDSKNPAWVHVSYKGEGNRKQVLRAIMQGGKTTYIPYVEPPISL